MIQPLWKTVWRFLEKLGINGHLSTIPKETISKMKRQPTSLEKIFANDVTNKGIISKIYKQLMTL